MKRRPQAVRLYEHEDAQTWLALLLDTPFRDAWCVLLTVLGLVAALWAIGWVGR